MDFLFFFCVSDQLFILISHLLFVVAQNFHSIHIFYILGAPDVLVRPVAFQTSGRASGIKLSLLLAFLMVRFVVSSIRLAGQAFDCCFPLWQRGCGCEPLPPDKCIGGQVVALDVLLEI